MQKCLVPEKKMRFSKNSKNDAKNVDLTMVLIQFFNVSFDKYCFFKKSAIYSQKINQLLSQKSFSKFYFLFYRFNISFTKLAKINSNLLLISTEKLESSKFNF
jgi:hypothetical protein